jgi:cytochrome c556
MQFLSRSMIAAGAALLCASVALPAAAQFAKPEDAIKYRKSAFTVMATHFGRVSAMASGRAPFDAKAAVENANLAAAMSKLPFTAFVDGTDKGETRALPKIWSENDKFKAAASKMQEEMARLDAAAKSGNLDAIKTATGETGKSCKACHDNYRKD